MIPIISMQKYAKIICKFISHIFVICANCLCKDSLIFSGVYDMSRYHEVLRSMYQQYGPVVRENFGFDTIVHVFDTEMAKYVQIPCSSITSNVFKIVFKIT